MGITVNTKFGMNARAYVLSYARDEGRLVGGIVDAIDIKIGFDGSAVPTTWYRMTQTVAFSPPGGMWAEYELGTEAEAQTLADAYNRALSQSYARRVS